MQTGALSITTGLYRTSCGCRADVEIARGVAAPVCPRCRKPVGWEYRRNTFWPGRHDPGAGDPAPAEGGTGEAGGKAENSGTPDRSTGSQD